MSTKLISTFLATAILFAGASFAAFGCGESGYKETQAPGNESGVGMSSMAGNETGVGSRSLAGGNETGVGSHSLAGGNETGVGLDGVIVQITSPSEQ